jgi:spore germination cell wall hydrolase CwlJ-like protein
MLSIALVIMNRANDPGKDWWGDTVEEVIKKPWQFTCWQDHNRPLMEAVTVFSDAKFREAIAAAFTAFYGLAPDLTNGANHYFNPKVVAAPRWALDLTPVATVGNHLFYKLAG